MLSHAPCTSFRQRMGQCLSGGPSCLDVPSRLLLQPLPPLPPVRRKLALLFAMLCIRLYMFLYSCAGSCATAPGLLLLGSGSCTAHASPALATRVSPRGFSKAGVPGGVSYPVGCGQGDGQWRWEPGGTQPKRRTASIPISSFFSRFGSKQLPQAIIICVKKGSTHAPLRALRGHRAPILRLQLL